MSYLNATSFVLYYSFHISDCGLNRSEKTCAAIASIALGILTAGMFHLICRTFFYEKDFILKQEDPLLYRLINEPESANFSHLINNRDACLAQMKQDTLDILKGKDSGFEQFSLGQVYEFSMKKKIYQTVVKGNEEYAKFKELHNQMRLSKIPFRAFRTVKNYVNGKHGINGSLFKKIPQDLQQYGLSKERKKRLLADYEIKLLQDCRPSLYQLANKILWAHGTNSSLLPFLEKTNLTLIPCGKLLEKGIAPMGGEIRLGGMVLDGVNQNWVSGCQVDGLKRCWKYASTISRSFDPSQMAKPESYFQKHLDILKKTNPEEHQYDLPIVALFRLKQWNLEVFQKMCQTHQSEIPKIRRNFLSKVCYREKLLLKALDVDRKKLEQAKSDPLVQQALEREFPTLSEMIIPQWHSCKGDSLISFFNDLNLQNNQFYSNYKEILSSLFKFRMYESEKLKEAEQAREEDELGNFQYLSLVKKLEGQEFTVENLFRCVLVPQLEERMRTQTAYFEQRMKRFDSLFSVEPQVVLQGQEREQVKNPFPILAASTRIQNMVEQQNNEYSVPQALLGEEIDLVFVPDRNEAEMTQWLQKNKLDQKVKVYSTDILEELNRVPLLAE